MNENVIIGAAFKNPQKNFKKPFDSVYLNILTSLEKFEPEKYNLSSVRAKMFRVNLNDSQIVFIPILHSL